MLLALKPTPMTDLHPPHDYSTFKSTPYRSHSPPPSPSPRNLPSFFEDNRMSNPHRGLPLPAGLNLPPPDRGPSVAPALGHLPAPPAQWAGQDDSMRSWLHAKAEEDRRKQEEEKTRQEGLRLDQRRIEQNMLRESLQGGIPPPMVPLIFAGMGGGNLPSHTLEWAQQYLASLSIQNQQQQQQIQAQQQQIQQQQQQQQQQPLPPGQMSPDMRRDSRMIPPNPYAGHQPQQPIQTTPQLSSQPAISATTGRPLGSSAAPPPPPQPSTALSRLNTTEFVPAPANSTQPRQPLHPLQQTQTAQSEQGSGPGLFFHHWTPPNNSGGGPLPPTPSGKSNHGSPFSQAAQSHLRADYQNSPKKRKMAGGHTAAQPPTSDPSPPFSARSSRERDREPSPTNPNRRPSQHSRQHSDASSRDMDPSSRPIARPSSRQQRQDELSGAPNSGPRRQHTGSSTSGSGSSEDAPPNHNHYHGPGPGMKSETR